MTFLSILLIILCSIIFIFYIAFVCDYESIMNDNSIQKKIQIVILILFLLVICILYNIEAKQLGM